MTDDNERRPDPQTPDETRTQWVPADRMPTEHPGASEEPGGWFQATPADSPRWANWDEPWDPSDQPFDQAAFEPSQPEYQTPSDRPPAVEERPLRSAEPVPTPANEHSSSWANLHALRILAQVACPILLLIGLTFGQDDAQTGWEAYTAWAIFAMVCAVVQLAPLARRSLGLTPESAWFLGAVGTAGLVGYWVIIVLPGVSSNAGFAQTLAAGLAVIGLWLSPGRRV